MVRLMGQERTKKEEALKYINVSLLDDICAICMCKTKLRIFFYSILQSSHKLVIKSCSIAKSQFVLCNSHVRSCQSNFWNKLFLQAWTFVRSDWSSRFEKSVTLLSFFFSFLLCVTFSQSVFVSLSLRCSWRGKCLNSSN